MHKWILALLLLSLALSVGCGGDSDSALSVGPSQNGQSVALDAGRSLVVELPGNPTTGYEWVVAQADAHLLEAAETEYQPDSDALGAGGRYTFRFRALASGSTPVVLAYRRSWEPDPIETFSLTVTIP